MNENRLNEKIGKLLKNKGTIISFAGIVIALLLIFSSKSPKTETVYETIDFLNTYTDITEKKISKIVESINGVNDVKVMVTFKNETIKKYDSKSDTNTFFNNSEQSSEYEASLPEIEGVAIICSGGKDPVIKSEITKLISSVFGIYSTHIYITE